MAEFTTVCKVEDLPPGGSKTVEVANRLVAVFQHKGSYFAIDDVCPHMGASLSEGDVEDGIVTCPWHGWRFRLADGVWADNPRLKIGCYAVRCDNGVVQVQKNDPPMANK
jgi:nitrite reductase (NADH) small subunit